MGADSLPLVSSELCLPDVHHDAGLLHPAAGVRHPRVVCGHRRRVVGLFVVLLHPYLCGTHLEVHHPGLHSAYHRGHGPCLPRAAAGRRTGDRAVCGPSDCFEPRADVLLLPVRHALPGRGLRCGGVAVAHPAPVLPGDGGARRGRTGGRGHQLVEPLPYLYVQQADHARAERAGAEGRRRCPTDGWWIRTRLYHSVELRHRRDLDVAHPQLQGRRLCSAGQQRAGHAEGRPAIRRAVPPTDAVLRHAADDGRAGLRGGVRAVPVPVGLLRGERTAEVGAGGYHGAVHPAVVGEEHDVADRPVHRLCTDVQQVPRGVVHPRHRRVHHSLAGRADVGQTDARARVAPEEPQAAAGLPAADGGRGAVVGRAGQSLAFGLCPCPRDADVPAGGRPGLSAKPGTACHTAEPVGSPRGAGAVGCPAQLLHCGRRAVAVDAVCRRASAPFVHRGRHRAAVPGGHVGREQALPERRTVRPGLCHHHQLHADRGRQAHPARQGSGLPRAESGVEHVQRKQNVILAQEHRRIPRRQAAPLSGAY